MLLLSVFSLKYLNFEHKLSKFSTSEGSNGELVFSLIG